MHLRLSYEAHPKPEKEQKAKAKALVNQSTFGLIGYVDSNYAGNSEDTKSAMGHCFFIHGAIVSWYSKKQKTVLNPTTEAKYIVLGNTIQESI